MNKLVPIAIMFSVLGLGSVAMMVNAQETIYHQVYQKPKEVGGMYCYSVNGTEQWCSNFRQIMIYNYSAMTEQDQKYIDESMRLQKYFKNGKAPQ